MPKIWETLKKAVEEQVGASFCLTRWLFRMGFVARYWAVKHGRESPLFKALIFRKVAATVLGGRLKVALSGGGPLSAEVQDFCRTVFATPLLQGYALTETTCAGAIQSPHDVRNGILGPPLPSVEMKLRSCLVNGEAEVCDRQNKPYTAADKLHYGTPCEGRGEILIAGPSVSLGYFNQKDKTDEVYRVDQNGKVWFHTGDVGLFTPDGCVQIIDRLKNLVKLKGGEYIAIESMESAYSASPLSMASMGVSCVMVMVPWTVQWHWCKPTWAS